MFTGKICVCSCVRFTFLSLTPLCTPTFHVVTSDVTLSQSQSPFSPSSNSWPTSWIGDEAAMAVPCFGKHPSIPAYSTNFIFQFPMVQLITSLHLAYMYFSTLTFAAPWNFIRFPSLPLLEPSLHQRSSELPFFDIENYKQPLYFQSYLAIGIFQTHNTLHVGHIQPA